MFSAKRIIMVRSRCNIQNGPLTLQVAPFFRLSRTSFSPDVAGELLFNGIADRARLSSDLFGVQADGSYKASGAHTLRYGLFYQRELTRSNDLAQVFPVDGTGHAERRSAAGLRDGGRKVGNLYGVYVQDEWDPLPRLTINVGARYDRVEAYTREQQVSPRLSIVYKASDSAAFHLGYARNFTPPPQELIASTDLNLFAGTTKAATDLYGRSGQGGARASVRCGVQPDAVAACDAERGRLLQDQAQPAR